MCGLDKHHNIKVGHALPKGKWIDGMYVIEDMKIEEIATMLTGIIDGDIQIMAEKGFIKLCLKSGAVVTIRANMLGDGLKRIIEFFKDYKKLVKKMPLKIATQFEQLTEKWEIDLEAL